MTRRCGRSPLASLRLMTAVALLAIPASVVPLPASPTAGTSAPTVPAASATATATAATMVEGGSPPVRSPDGERQAALVAAEDQRLKQVRSVAPAAPYPGQEPIGPFRVVTDHASTLVLTRRSTPYTIEDVLELSPRTVVRQPDGAYLVAENLYVNFGAVLNLSTPEGLTLRLASDPRGFVSIVSYGGELALNGTAKAPLKITSWDSQTAKPDINVLDGRAYVRAIGGHFSLNYAAVSDLGFWSGRTGGLGFTGTDTTNAAGSKTSTVIESAGSGQAPPISQYQPSIPDFTGGISNSTISGNAFGLYISNGNRITISDTTVERSFGDGIVLSRFAPASASDATIKRTISRFNGGDGFVLSRATQRVLVDRWMAEGNGENGVTISGQPLASGFSTSGESLVSYGANSVAHGIARNNGHYGIEIVGGIDVSALKNEVEGGDMGVVVRDTATRVTVTENNLRGQSRQGIAMRDGVMAATIADNHVTGLRTAVYVRDSVVQVRGNTIENGTHHGVAFVGNATGCAVVNNVIAGVGSGALDSSRAIGDITVLENQTDNWHKFSSFWMGVRHYASPMTLLWTSILVLIVFSAVKGRRIKRREAGGVRLGTHPYADKNSLVSPPPREIPTGGAGPQ
jgi:Right handed beta helix region